MKAHRHRRAFSTETAAVVDLIQKGLEEKEWQPDGVNRETPYVHRAAEDEKRSTRLCPENRECNYAACSYKTVCEQKTTVDDGLPMYKPEP